MEKNFRNISCAVILGLTVVCLGALAAFYFLIPNESDIICNNLLEAARLDSKRSCINSNWPLDYLPQYFPVGNTTIEDVKIGMQGFEVLSEFTNTSCQENKEFTLLRYGLRPFGTTYAEELSFKFCDDILTDITYHD